MKGMVSNRIQSHQEDCSFLHVGLYCWKSCNLISGKVVYYKMACDVFKSGQHGYCGICALIALTMLLLLSANRATECDWMFVRNTDGPKNGTFVSPNHTKSNGDAPPLQCIYTFIAYPNERIKISFTYFNLTGAPPDGSSAGTRPECNHEYLDLYTEVPSRDVDLIATPFGGRYCGRIPPRLRISLYNILVISFYSDQKSVEGVFQGTYEFVDGGQYVLGTPLPNTTCSFKILSKEKRGGNIQSPTYPGVYPKNLVCSYKFEGDAGQRIRVEFMDFDLFYGGVHCPYDHVKIYDGSSTSAPLIGPYCGQRRSLVLYSSGENLFIQFTTLKRTADTQNRGFSGIYKFSESYVRLDFIRRESGEHIRGTECDQRILSKRESSGNVFSPNYPFIYHQNILCRYFIYGLQDMQNLEHVRLEFEKFEMPTINEKCTNNTHLKLYLHGQETIPAFDKHDLIFCGNTLPPVIVSEGPRLVMVFSSGSSQGQGFKARYAFETEFQIPGTQEPNRSCQFKYLSKSHKEGVLNSPRFPSNYPSNITCTYMLKGERSEQVRLVFDEFKVKVSNESSMYGTTCQQDWVEIYNVYPDDSTHLIGRYCGNTAPGPIISDIGSNEMKIIFNTDADGVLSGFRVRYSFETRGPIFGDCGSNITGLEFGFLASPGYPDHYAAHNQTCNWYIYAKPRHRVFLQFQEFSVEGLPQSRGCPSATVRIWTDLISTPQEKCGQKLSTEQWEYLSEGNVMRLTFIAADKAVGSPGFKAVWAEVKEGPDCDLFHCKNSGLCIPVSLCCNDFPNCGFGDNSDEKNCEETAGINIYLLVGLLVGIVVVILLGICMWCHRKHKRRRRDPRPPENRLSHSCEVPGARFSSMDSV